MSKNIILSSLNNNNITVLKNEILTINKDSQKYGLTLTEKDADEIIKSRNYSLKTYGRIDLNLDITKKIINKLYKSQYTDKDDYVELINNLQDIFYYMKNETLDQISDDELIDIISKFYEQAAGNINNIENLSEKFLLDYKKGSLNI